MADETLPEEDMEWPMDIEFGFSNGKLFIVQMRPVIAKFSGPVVTQSAQDFQDKTRVAITPVAFGQTPPVGISAPMRVYGLKPEAESIDPNPHIRIQDNVAVYLAEHPTTAAGVGIAAGAMTMRGAGLTGRQTMETKGGQLNFGAPPGVRNLQTGAPIVPPTIQAPAAVPGGTMGAHYAPELAMMQSNSAAQPYPGNGPRDWQNRIEGQRGVGSVSVPPPMSGDARYSDALANARLYAAQQGNYVQ